MNLEHCQRIYFLGIGGIGMSAIARYFKLRGKEIFGYDLANTSLTKKLEAEGMKIHYDIDITKIPDQVDLVIYTPAIPDDHAELQWFRDNGFVLKKRAEVLGLLSREQRCIAIAGTHGKTTTSSILSHILKYCSLDISAFLGGILVEENSNFIHGESDLVVLEADEFDRSFLHLYPEILVILSTDPDHLDIYGDHQSLVDAYEQLTYQVNDDGVIIIADDFSKQFSPNWKESLSEKGIRVLELGKHFRFDEMQVKQERFHFDYYSEFGDINDIKSQMPGEHNISNSTIAILIAQILNCSDTLIKEALANFQGVKRRFEMLWDKDIVLIDDYAHHPSELTYAIETLNKLYPKRYKIGIFQPHLYSRTSDFYRGFAKALSDLDEAWVLNIYPARELPMEGVSSELIYNLIESDTKRIMNATEFIGALKAREDLDVIMTIGASDIDKYHKELIELVKQ